jgi:hypothetical protein
VTATTCQRCNAKCALFLCTNCSAELKDMLLHLPRWLDYLHDATVGNTRLGESARRSTDLGSPMPCPVGPKGDWKGSPSELYQQVHNTLSRWVQDICESRGVEL